MKHIVPRAAVSRRVDLYEQRMLPDYSYVLITLSGWMAAAAAAAALGIALAIHNFIACWKLEVKKKRRREREK